MIRYDKMWMSIIFVVLLQTGCKKDNEGVNNLVISTDFKNGKDNWVAGFSDYNGNNVEIYELEEDLSTLPAPLDQSKAAFRISGINRSDDLFMFLKRSISGLKPSTTYKASFYLEIASNAPNGGIGAGGAPGESVGMGIGMTNTEPVSEPDENNFYRMNIDKINQCCTDGEDMMVIGNMANGGEEYVYKIIKRNGEFTAQTDTNGDLWLIIGTDSGFEGTTTLYYSTIKVTIEAL